MAVVWDARLRCNIHSTPQATTAVDTTTTTTTKVSSSSNMACTTNLRLTISTRSCRRIHLLHNRGMLQHWEEGASPLHLLRGRQIFRR